MVTRPVAVSSTECRAADEIYKFLDLVKFIAERNGRSFWYIDEISSGPHFYEPK
jgi:hypothetical protein